MVIQESIDDSAWEDYLENAAFKYEFYMSSVLVIRWHIQLESTYLDILPHFLSIPHLVLLHKVGS